MEAIGKIGYRWHEEAVERYLYMQPLEEPSEGDWMEAVQLVLDDYQFDSIFMIIDIVGFAPVLTKASFDEVVKHQQARGLRRSTVAVVLDEQVYERVARMFEASSETYGFDLTMRAFRTSTDAVDWLNGQMTGD